ncbi:MAG: hypothetical protein INR71_15120, partial [Terriglobus roseus]|nr:hypothetical protein [Terriglobus roseus]
YPHLKVKKSVQSKNQKTNPVACYKVSAQRINAFAFSPDSRHLAVVSEDGSFRVLDFLAEKVLDLHTSYYGGFLSVCWSPDGRYVVTGGQDDLVSIWSLADAALVARCQGHNSWVTGVAFDPWRCDERNYRFGSIGEDCRLLLWDFNVSMLHRPRAAMKQQQQQQQQHQRERGSISSTTRLRAESTQSMPASTSEEVVHPVEPRLTTAMLPPVMAKEVDAHPLSWLAFEDDCIMTACVEGTLFPPYPLYFVCPLPDPYPRALSHAHHSPDITRTLAPATAALQRSHLHCTH